VKLAPLISPGLWDLLERVRGHLDVVVDIVDLALTPLLPPAEAPAARLVRHLTGLPGPHGLRDRCALAAQSGQHQVFDTRALHVAVFPLRHDRRVAGLLVVASALVQDGAPEPVRQRLERLAWSLRATLEADMDAQLRLGREEGRARWLATVPRFLEHLHRCTTEEALFDALVQGAAIWGDIDARVYRRTLAGGYQLAAALPAVVAEAPVHGFPGSLLALRRGPVRVTSIAEMEQFGWSAASGEVLVLPLGEPEPQVVLALAGPVDGRLEETFSAASLVAAACLRGLAAERARRLEFAVRGHLVDPSSGFPGPVTSALSDIAGATGATHARVLLQESGAPGGVRTLAAVGGSQVDRLPRELPQGRSLRLPDRLVVPLFEGGGAGWLDLGCGGTRRFGPGEAELAERAAGLLGPWLAGALQALSQSGVVPAALAPSGFEPRIQEELERARRFNLELGLLVIGAEDAGADRHALALVPLVEAVRSQLRGSDLVGRLADGSIAALVVHTDERGLGAVAARVERRLARLTEGPGAGARVGRAAYPGDGDTPDALAASARADLGRRASAAVRPLVTPAEDTDQPGRATRAS
jgi:GGDEF domain-containing protein